MNPSVSNSLRGAAAALCLGAIVCSGNAEAQEKRFAQLTLENVNEQQRPIAEQILKVSSIGLTGPYNPLLRSPVLATRWRGMFDYLRFNSSVPTRLNEFASRLGRRSAGRSARRSARRSPVREIGPLCVSPLDA